MDNNTNFVEFNDVERIWAIGSIHSNLKSFVSIKDYILKNFKKRDKLIFLGNVIGLGDYSKEIISSILKLRFDLMAKFKLNPEDVVFLRGAQEEMFSKILQLHTAPNPGEIIKWVFDHGVDKTLKSYGFSKDEIINIATSGTVNISKWTSKLNKKIMTNSGHKEYFTALKHAAYSSSKKILFVNRGVDISRPLSAQNDCFWWGYQNFSRIEKPYSSFVKIVRGYQSLHKNNIEFSKNTIVCTLFKQPLTNNKILSGVFSNDGKILELFESN